MKRNLKTKFSFYSIFFLLIFMCPIALTAQEIGASYKTGDTPTSKEPYNILGEIGEFTYVAYKGMEEGVVLGFAKYDKEMELVGTYDTKLKYEGKLIYVEAAMIEEGSLFGLGCIHDKTTNEGIIIKQKIDLSTLEASEDYEIISKVENVSKSGFRIKRIKYSVNNKMKVMEYSFYPISNKNTEYYGLVVCDDNGKAVYQRDINLNKFPYKKYYNKKFSKLNNDGSYIFYFETVNNEKKSQYILLRFSKNDEEYLSFDISYPEYGITDIDIVYNNENSLVAVGSYGNKKTGMYGHFYQNINLVTGSLDKMILHPLDYELINSTCGKDMTDYFIKNKYLRYSYTTLGSKLCENGSIMLIQEDIYRSNEVNYCGNIYISSFDKSGKLNWQKIIPKTNVGVIYHQGSIMLDVDDQLYITFNDNPKNEKVEYLNVLKDDIQSTSDLENKNVVLLKIEENGQIQKKVFKSTGAKMPILGPYFGNYIKSSSPVFVPCYVSRTTFSIAKIVID